MIRDVVVVSEAVEVEGANLAFEMTPEGAICDEVVHGGESGIGANEILKRYQPALAHWHK